MKGTVLAFVSAFVVVNTTWLYSITSSFHEDVLQWIEERNMKKIVHRRKLEFQQIQISRSSLIKHVIVVLCMQCVRSKGWGKVPKWYWLELTSWINLHCCHKQHKEERERDFFQRIFDVQYNIILEDFKTFQKTGLCQTLWNSKTCSMAFNIILSAFFQPEHD